MTNEDNKLKNVKFSIIKENWNEYILGDEVTLRIRILLMKVVEQKKEGKIGFFFDISQPLIAIYCSEEKMGEKENEPKPHEFESLEKEPVDIVTPIEHWNEYRVEGLETPFRIKYMVSSLDRVKNRFNNNGEPFYLINGGPFLDGPPIPKK